MVHSAGLKGLQKKIFLPVNISVLASVGIHGVLLGVILPKWDVDPQSDRDRTLSNTPVIELNEFEQTRLPNLSWSRVNVLAKLPSPNTQIPNLPTLQPDSRTITALPLPPSLPSYPSSSLNIPTPSTLPAPPPLSAIDSTVIGKSPASQRLTLPSEAEDLNMKTRQSLFPALANEQQIDPRELVNRRAFLRRQNQKRPIAASPSNSNINQRDSNSNRVVIKSPPAKSPSYDRLSSMLQQDASNTTNEEARKNYVGWLKDVEDATPEQINLTGIYPKDACIRKLEGTTAYGVIVNAQGKVVDSRLIKSGGYPLFNQQALTQIQEKSFANSTGGSKPYHVYINFNYNPDVCPSLSLSGVNAPPAQSKSNPNPQLNSDSTPKLEQNQQQSTPAAINSPPKSSLDTEEVNPPLPPANPETPLQQSTTSPPDKPLGKELITNPETPLQQSTTSPPDKPLGKELITNPETPPQQSTTSPPDKPLGKELINNTETPSQQSTVSPTDTTSQPVIKETEDNGDGE